MKTCSARAAAALALAIALAIAAPGAARAQEIADPSAEPVVDEGLPLPAAVAPQLDGAGRPEPPRPPDQEVLDELVELEWARFADCPRERGRPRLECRARVIDDLLPLVETDLASRAHGDDTGPTVMLVAGLASIGGGVAGIVASVVSGGGLWVALPIVTGISGLVSAIVGLVWLSRNGRPWRMRDTLHEWRDDFGRRLSLVADASEQGASLAARVRF